MQPAIVSYYDMSAEERAAIGMKDNLVRIALGVEDSADILRDVAQALDRLHISSSTDL
jgi:cystathionine gamma-synthase